MADAGNSEAEDAAEARDRPSNPNAVHMLRTMQGHHIALSSMADQKANILIGVNSVIFALVMRDAGDLTLPMLVLAASSGLAAILCILVVVPSIGARKPKGPQPPPNILFFGAFSNLSEAEFIDTLDVIDADDLLIRRAMARDAYQLGIVLKTKKYKYLGWAYRVFMAGLVLTFLAFLAEKLFG
jgi:hypothetical protein